MITIIHIPIKVWNQAISISIRQSAYRCKLYLFIMVLTNGTFIINAYIQR